MLFSSYSFSILALMSCVALLLNLLLAGPRSLWSPVVFLHPLNLLERALRRVSEKLNRFRRTDEQREMRGLMLVLAVLLAMVMLGNWLQQIFVQLRTDLLELGLLAMFLGARQAFDRTMQVEKLLVKSPGVVSSEILSPRLVRRQQREYDSATVIRGSIEAMMVSLSESVVAPLFYYIIAGWPGVMAVGIVTVMDDALGYRNPQYQHFGRATAILHTLLQWIPARIAGISIVLASGFAPACQPLTALRILLTQAGRTASANAGWPIAAAAGALGITLGGPRAMFGSYIADQWIGEGKVQVNAKALKAARWLYAIAVLLLVMILLFLSVT